MQPLTRGQKVRLADLTSSHNIRVRLVFAVSNYQRVEFACFGVNAQGELADNRFLVFREQPESPDGSIRRTERQRNDVCFEVWLDNLPPAVQRLVFTATVDDNKTMGDLLEGVARISDDIGDVACYAMIGEDFIAERAIIAVELYYKEGWRLSAGGQGFNAGLTALREHLGGGHISSTLPCSGFPGEVVKGVKSTRNREKEKDMADLEKLAADIIADGKVDATEVAKLREVLYADGVIDREEADALFKINNAVSGNQNDPAWKDFFVKAITKHLLGDAKSSGAVDDDEAKWLVAAIEGDGILDDAEKALLVNIKAKASDISAILKAKMDACNV